MTDKITLPDWHPDCGGDWVLSGPGFFANYWPDNCVSASIIEGEDGKELASSGLVYLDSKAECMAFAERWIKEQMAAFQLRCLCGNREDHDPHVFTSTVSGNRVWCHADQSKRLPYAMERRDSNA
jgi:hypothetical protein